MVKEKDKKIYELWKSERQAREDYEKEVKDFKDFKAKAMFEKKEEETQRKKQLKKDKLNNREPDVKCDSCECDLPASDTSIMHVKSNQETQTEFVQRLALV